MRDVTAQASSLDGAQAMTSSSTVASRPPWTRSLQPTKSGPGVQVVLARLSPSSIFSPMPIGFVVPHAKQWWSAKP